MGFFKTLCGNLYNPFRETRLNGLIKKGNKAEAETLLEEIKQHNSSSWGPFYTITERYQKGIDSIDMTPHMSRAEEAEKERLGYNDVLGIM